MDPDPWEEALRNADSHAQPVQQVQETAQQQWADWNRIHSRSSETRAEGISYMTSDEPHTTGDGWEEAQADADGSFPTYGQDDSGVVWKKMDVEDKPPEWNGDDPVTQAEVYINMLRMWKYTTGHEKKKQAKMVVDRMKGKLRGLIVDMLNPETEEDGTKTFPLFKEDALDEVLKRLEKEYKEFLDNPLPIVWNNLIYSPERFKKANETFRQFVKRTERALDKV